MKILQFCLLTVSMPIFWLTRKVRQLKLRNSQIIPGDLVFLKIEQAHPAARPYSNYRDRYSNNSCRWQ